MMREWEGSEAEALDDSGFRVALVSDQERYERHRPAHQATQRSKDLEYKYDKAKSAPVGSMIQCPVCGTSIKKTTYHKVFCSNQKTVRRGSCKDRYNNMIAFG